MKTINIKEALQFGWNTLKANFAFFLKLLVVLIIITAVPTFVVGKLATSLGVYLGLPLQFLNIIWQAVIGMGVLKICLKLHDQQPVEIADLWSCIPQTLDYVVVKFLVTLIVAAGLILLIVPGLIWSVQFFMASYLVVDRGAGAIAALKGSSAITHGAKWDLGVFISVVLFFEYSGDHLFGCGLADHLADYAARGCTDLQKTPGSNGSRRRTAWVI